ncbi:hypothetical protein AAHH79_42125, partial [Burkholderia pseudomallei]
PNIEARDERHEPIASGDYYSLRAGRAADCNGSRHAPCPWPTALGSRRHADKVEPRYPIVNGQFLFCLTQAPCSFISVP